MLLYFRFHRRRVYSVWFTAMMAVRDPISYFLYSFDYHFFFQPQVVGGRSTLLSKLLDKPWSQVGAVPSRPKK